MKDETVYLGDGLYAVMDKRGGVTLSTLRGDGEHYDGEHYVVLEPQILAKFQEWLRAKGGET